MADLKGDKKLGRGAVPDEVRERLADVEPLSFETGGPVLTEDQWLAQQFHEEVRARTKALRSLHDMTEHRDSLQVLVNTLEEQTQRQRKVINALIGTLASVASVSAVQLLMHIF